MTTAKWISIWLYSTIIWLSCASHQRWATQLDWSEFRLAETPTRANYPEMPAVILLDAGKMQVFPD
ncbi:hypothetical protein L0128_20590, partial [candidate division KSB1 bacterium]|nr:hypothetical protein [candidate division KSB1 bacterium]